MGSHCACKFYRAPTRNDCEFALPRLRCSSLAGGRGPALPPIGVEAGGNEWIIGVLTVQIGKELILIDVRQGKSERSDRRRMGAGRLVTEVSLGHAGIVMGLEVSRLARNSSDWHRLLEICALTDTLVLDDDGLYNPAYFNDRLLLGLKGTMSEAELHVMRARLRGGIINKARRGELEMRLPIGFLYDADGQVRLDPDTSIQTSVRQLFSTFRRTGSAVATVKEFSRARVAVPAAHLTWTKQRRRRVE